MGKKADNPKLPIEQEKLLQSYNIYSKYMLENLLKSEDFSNEKVIQTADYLKNERNRIEYPLFKTCKEYYDQGCKSTQISYMIDLIVSAVFGAGIGLFTSPGYLLIALTLTAPSRGEV